MRRREFIAAVATVLNPGLAQAQRVPLVAVVSGFDENDPRAQAEVAEFRAGLGAAGLVEGTNVRVEYHWGARSGLRTDQAARTVVAFSPDVIVGRATPAVSALLRETVSIPVVFVVVSDPVGAGFVQSLAVPGRNATGFTNVDPGIGGKWVEFLKELDPGITRVGVMFNPDTSPWGTPDSLRPLEAAARTFHVELEMSPVRHDTEIGRAMEALSVGLKAGLVLAPDQWFTDTRRKLTIQLHREHKLAAVGPHAVWAQEGLLAAYGVDTADLFRRAADYVSRILKGAKVSELPVQLPERFETAVNVNTAKALGLTIPPTLLARADEVIE